MQSDFEAQFLYAAKNGYIERAERLLLDGSYDPAKDDNAIVQWASTNNHFKVLQVLLKDKRVDPTINRNFCLQTACTKGYLGIVQLLLADGRADPQDENGIALWMAAYNGHLNIVKLLVQDGRVNIYSISDGLLPIEAALLHDHYEVADLLLQASRTHSQGSSTTVTNLDPSIVELIKQKSSPNLRAEASVVPSVVTNMHKKSISDISLSPTVIDDDGSTEKPQIETIAEVEEDSCSDDYFVEMISVATQTSFTYKKPNGYPLDHKLLKLVQNRNRVTQVEFVEYLVNLTEEINTKDQAVSSLGFNNALLELLKPCGTPEPLKNQYRGDVYSFTRDLLMFAQNNGKLLLAPDTQKQFSKKFGATKAVWRFINGKRNPVELLKKYSKASQPPVNSFLRKIFV
ncbi:hypothetical protein HK103_006718 [Boothiomyces macroporosus]|uniref:Ankyrin repeat protein n=1 Tax=Boothiomyces macroporosus TaxID=261099 RepID=A0AAD5UGD6_9FUNG|nr:hypothetical protein HK103_006718 [Boothiomyces macroporosus]